MTEEEVYTHPYSSKPKEFCTVVETAVLYARQRITLAPVARLGERALSIRSLLTD